MEYDRKRFHVLARRMFSKEPWTEWTQVNDYDVAIKHAKRVEAVGFEAKIADKGVSNRC